MPTNFDYLKEGEKQPHTEHGKVVITAAESDKTKGVYEDTGTGLNEKFDSKVMVKSSTKKTHNL